MLIYADFHIHSPFSGGTSDKIDLRKVAEGAKKKGLDVIGTGDCLHPAWQREIKKYEKNGDIEIDGVHFILTTEVEDKNRVHHLILFPDFYSVNDFKKRIAKHAKNVDYEGRPKIMIGGSEILEFALDSNALIGPAHAFTPWTSLYAYFDSMLDYYGGKPSFIELGLSADSNYADRIKELHTVPFLTNSDSHSYSPHRLGREFNRLDVEEITWEGIRNAILNKKIVMNAGFPPEKGKYNRTACSSCYRQYSIEEAKKMGWKCLCGGKVKKGVRDRIDEIADFKEAHHPEDRPPYMHIIPLAEIIAEALNSNPFSSTVKKRWSQLLKIGNEISILIDIEIERIMKIAPPAVADAISAFREGRVKIIPGGGGKYGEIVIE